MKLQLFLTGLLYITSQLFSNVFAQQVSIKWENTYQATNEEYHLALIKTSKNRILLDCLTFSDSGYDKTMNALHQGTQLIGVSKWNLMLDDLGNKIWDRDFYGVSIAPAKLVEISPDSFALCTRVIGDVHDDVTDPPSPGIHIGTFYNSTGTWTVGFDSTGTIQWNKRFDIGYDSLNIITSSQIYSSFLVLANDMKAINGKLYILGRATVLPTLVGGDVIGNNCLMYPAPNHNLTYPDPFYHQDMMLYKLDPKTGNKYEWQHLYGGDSVEYGLCLQPIPGQGFLLGGVTTSFAGCNQTVSAYAKPYSDWFIVRTDTIGNPIWQKRFGGSKDELLNGIIDSGNDNYLLYGYTMSPQSFDVSSSAPNDTSIWMMMIDSQGNKLWDKRYSGCKKISRGYIPVQYVQGYGDNGIAGIRCSDGGFLFTASVNDSLPCGDVSEAGKGGYDYWLLKTDSIGNKLWDKRFGGPGDDYANRLVEMSPGNYVIGGLSNSAAGGDKSESSLISINCAPCFNTDIWLICVTDSAALTSIQQQSFSQTFSIVVSPNPAKDIFTINTTATNASEKLNLTIFNSLGKEVKTIKSISSSQTINCNGWSAGIYLLKFTDSKGKIGSKKIVKE